MVKYYSRFIIVLFIISLLISLECIYLLKMSTLLHSKTSAKETTEVIIPTGLSKKSNQQCRTDFNFSKDPIIMGTLDETDQFPWFSNICDFPCKYVLISQMESPKKVDIYFHYHPGGGSFEEYSFLRDNNCPLQQKLAYHSWEPWFPSSKKTNDAAAADSRHLKSNYDIIYGPFSSSNVFVSYLGDGNFYDFRKAPLFPKPSGIPMAIAFVSNCGFKVTSNRLEVIQKLQSFGVTIDLFGKCFNRQLPSEIQDPDQPANLRSKRKREFMRKYKFVLAFENNILDGYVSEKYWEALQEGVVPIYFGAPDIDKYEPFPGVTIPVLNYIGPQRENLTNLDGLKSLAEEIIRLSMEKNSEEYYERFLSYKKKPFSDNFLALHHYNTETVKLCMVCKCYADEYLRQNQPQLFLNQKHHNDNDIVIYLRRITHFQFKELKIKDLKTFTLDALKIAIQGLFGTKKKIHRIIRPGLKFNELMWSENLNDVIRIDEQVKQLKSGDLFEFIDLPNNY